MKLAKQNPIGINSGAGVVCSGYPCGNFNVSECQEHIKANPNNYPVGSTSSSINTTSANDVMAAHSANQSPK